MIPKSGIMPHALWSMDGRTWIETCFDKEKPIFKHALAKGWVKIIPYEKMAEFIDSI